MSPFINRSVSASALAALALSLLTASAANAQNLLLNPGFESGTADWTFAGAVETAQYEGYGLTPTPEFGTTLANFNSGVQGPTGVVSQTFATTQGTTYDASFFFGNFGFDADQRLLAEALDSDTNTILGSVTASDNSGQNTFTGIYAPFSFAFTATGTQTTLRFTDQSIQSGNLQSSDGLLDNVSVVVVPEASTFALVLPALGMVGAVVIAKRRKK